MTDNQYSPLVLAHSYYDHIGNILKDSDQELIAYFHGIAYLLQEAHREADCYRHQDIEGNTFFHSIAQFFYKKVYGYADNSPEQEKILYKVELPTPVLRPLLHFIQKEALGSALNSDGLLIREDFEGEREEKNSGNNENTASALSSNEMAHTEDSFAWDNSDYSTLGRRFYKDSPYNFIVMDKKELGNLSNASIYYQRKKAKEISDALNSARRNLWDENIVVLHDRYLEPLRYYVSEKKKVADRK